MAKTYFKTCPYCGARLDPGEHCDCRRARTERKPEKRPEAEKKEGAA